MTARKDPTDPDTKPATDVDTNTETAVDTDIQTDAELRAFIARAIRIGPIERDRCIEDAAEYFEDSSDAHQARAAALYDALRAEHRREQATWPEVTDWDRLDRAFTALNHAGIVARHDFACCQTCGHAEIGDEIHAAKQSGQTVRGYTFYHRQDTERAVEAGNLYLAYGAVGDTKNTEGAEGAEGAEDDEDPDAAQAEVARAIVGAIEAEELPVEWNQSVRTRILIPDIDWQRRW